MCWIFQSLGSVRDGSELPGRCLQKRQKSGHHLRDVHRHGLSVLQVSQRHPASLRLSHRAHRVLQRAGCTYGRGHCGQVQLWIFMCVCPDVILRLKKLSDLNPDFSPSVVERRLAVTKASRCCWRWRWSISSWWWWESSEVPRRLTSQRRSYGNWSTVSGVRRESSSNKETWWTVSLFYSSCEFVSFCCFLRSYWCEGSKPSVTV